MPAPLLAFGAELGFVWRSAALVQPRKKCRPGSTADDVHSGYSDGRLQRSLPGNIGIPLFCSFSSAPVAVAINPCYGFRLRPSHLRFPGPLSPPSRDKRLTLVRNIFGRKCHVLYLGVYYVFHLMTASADGRHGLGSDTNPGFYSPAATSAQCGKSEPADPTPAAGHARRQ